VNLTRAEKGSLGDCTTLRLWPLLGAKTYIDDWRAWSADPTLISNAPGADLGQGSALRAQRGLLLRRLLENRNACAAPFFSGLTLIAHAVDLCFHHVIFIYKRLLMATSCPRLDTAQRMPR